MNDERHSRCGRNIYRITGKVLDETLTVSLYCPYIPPYAAERFFADVNAALQKHIYPEIVLEKERKNLC